MIYLNNAATSSPKPEEVYAAVERALRDGGTDFGRGGDRVSQKNSEKSYECRCELANLFGIGQPDRVIFTGNATQAINVALKGILKRGDHLILSDMEHNAVLRPALKLQAEGRISVSIVESDGNGIVSARAVAEHLRPNTALVEVTHMSNVTGAVNDVATLGDLCRQAHVPFMVDASQTAGLLDIHVERQHIDILVAPGHKGLLGPAGTGVLYLAPRLHADTLIEGGTGSDSLLNEQPSRAPERFEAGTMNLPGIAGLLAGIRFVAQQGVARIAEHKRGLVKRLHDALAELDGFRVYLPQRFRPTLLAFNLDGCDSVELAEFLAHNEISVRGGFHCAASVHRKFGTLKTGMLRVSPGPFSTAADIDVCVDVVRRYLTIWRNRCGRFSNN